MRTLPIALIIMFVSTSLVAEDAAEDKQPQIQYWIAKLSDQDPKVRDQAAESLRRFGKDALPGLSDAARGKDPQVRDRAAAVARQIESDAVEEPEGIDVLPPAQSDDRVPRRIAPRLRIELGPLIIPRAAEGFQRFNRTLSFAENGRTINILEDNDGITITSTEKRDGQTITRVFKSKDKDALKAQHPEAFELYEKYTGRMNVRQFRPMLLPPGGFDRLDLADMHRDQIERAFDRARQSMLDQRKLMDRQRDMLLEHRKLVEELRKQAMEEIERVRRDLDGP